jgi:ribosomal protein L37AE/L43A
MGWFESDLYMEHQASFVIVMLVFLAVVQLGFIGALLWVKYMEGAYEDTDSSASKAVRCPSCGVQNAIVVGVALEVCSHCGSSLAATAEQMRRGIWELAVAARRGKAVPHLPEVSFGEPEPAAESSPIDAVALAASLCGRRGLGEAARWLNGYWPENLFLSRRGTFVVGHCRGFPVLVHCAQPAYVPLSVGPRPDWSTLRLVVLVAALSLPSDAVEHAGVLDVWRSAAGYRAEGWISAEQCNERQLLELVDGVCALVQREGCPPAPYLGA